MTSPPVGAKGGRGHAPDAQSLGDVLVVGLVRDARVGEVVLRPDDLATGRGEAIDATVERELELEHPGLGRLVRCADEDDRAEMRAVLGEQGQMGAVRAEQPARLLDDRVEDRPRLMEGRDPAGDVAKGPLGLDPAGELLRGTARAG